MYTESDYGVASAIATARRLALDVISCMVMNPEDDPREPAFILERMPEGPRLVMMWRAQRTIAGDIQAMRGLHVDVQLLAKRLRERSMSDNTYYRRPNDSDPQTGTPALILGAEAQYILASVLAKCDPKMWRAIGPDNHLIVIRSMMEAASKVEPMTRGDR